MKIALVAPTPIPARRANTIQVMKMAQALAELGHEVRLAAPRDRLAGKGEKQVANADGRRVAGSSLQAAGESWDRLADHYGLRTFFQVDWLPAHPAYRRYDYGYRAVRWARGWGAELLYTRLPQAAAFASQMRMATILECHDMPGGLAGAWLMRLFLWGAGARRLVVITQALLEDLNKKYKIPATVKRGLRNKREESAGSERSFVLIAPDGVDLERYLDLPAPREARRWLVERQLLSEAGWAGAQQAESFIERLAVGYTGHLYAGRGIELILELARTLPEVNFLLVGGESADVSRVRDQIHAAQLQNVACLGFVANADLPLYQAACDILLMPYQKRVSASSGGNIARYLSPMKLFEYLACGRVIMCSDLPVLREVLNEHNAILLPADDPSAWVNAMRSLQARPGWMSRLSEQARQEAVKYTWRERAWRVVNGLADPVSVQQGE